MDDLTTKCINCGKEVSHSVHGSLNSWLFRRAECQCDPGWRAKAQPGLQLKQLFKAASNHQQPSNIHSPELAPNKPTAGRSRDPLVGSVLDSRYEVLENLGVGAWGAVYKATDRARNRLVAVKVLHPTLQGESDCLDRFRREGMVSRTLRHRNIVLTLDWKILPDGHPYIVMEFLEGRTLSAILNENGALKAGDAVRIFLALTDALAMAHRQGIVHRDLKPGNIMIVKSPSGELLPKILDFGLSKVLSTAERSLTGTGELVGTIAYISPEQCKSMPIDNRSDIYSLGCIMYETITGRKAFEAPDAFSCLHKHIYQYPPPFAEISPHIFIPKTLSALEKVVFRALQKEPERRFQSMEELHDVLQRLSQGEQDVAVDNWSVRSQWITTFAAAQSEWWPRHIHRAFRLVPMIFTAVIICGLSMLSFLWITSCAPGTDRLLYQFASNDPQKHVQMRIFFAQLATDMGNTAAARVHAKAALDAMLDPSCALKSAGQCIWAMTNLFVLDQWLDDVGEYGKFHACRKLADKFVNNHQLAAAELTYASAYQWKDRRHLAISQCRRLERMAWDELGTSTPNLTDVESRLVESLALCSVIAANNRPATWIYRDALEHCRQCLLAFYEPRGRWEEAVMYRQRTIGDLASRGDYYKLAGQLGGLGFGYYEIGNLQKADALYNQAEKYAVEYKDDWEAVITYARHSELYMMKEKYDKADECATKAIDIAMYTTQPLKYDSLILINYPIDACLAVYKKEGKFLDAERVIQRGLMYYETHKQAPAWNAMVSNVLDKYIALLSTMPNRSKDLEQLQTRKEKLRQPN